MYKNKNRNVPYNMYKKYGLLDDIESIYDSGVISSQVPKGALIDSCTYVPYIEQDIIEDNVTNVQDSSIYENTIIPETNATLESDILVKSIHKLFILSVLLEEWRIKFSTFRQTISIARINEVIKLSNKYLGLHRRVNNMNVPAFSSNKVNATLDIMKYVKPIYPTSIYMKIICSGLRKWICVSRMRKHKSGYRIYPVNRIRETCNANRVSGFTWVNPQYAKKWGSLLYDNNKYDISNRIANKPTSNVHPPDEYDWVHRYLMGYYNYSSLKPDDALVIKRRYDIIRKNYQFHIGNKNYITANQIAWDFEYNTYTTEDFYHDYHMGNIVNLYGRTACNFTRKSRVFSMIYSNKYNGNVNYYKQIIKQ